MLKKHAMELIMGCLLLLCFYCLSREAAAVSARMSQKKVIVVDCGHGGIDPGMIGIDGLKEKEFNLAIGMKKGSGGLRLSGGDDQGNRYRTLR